MWHREQEGDCLVKSVWGTWARNPVISVPRRESHKLKYICVCLSLLVPTLPFPLNLSLAALEKRRKYKYNPAVPWTSGAEGSTQTFPCAIHMARPEAGSFCFPGCMSSGKAQKARYHQQRGERYSRENPSLWMTFRSDCIQASGRDEEEEWVENPPLHAVWFDPRVEKEGGSDLLLLYRNTTSEFQLAGALRESVIAVANILLSLIKPESSKLCSIGVL